MEGQSQKALENRLRVLKTAWVFGNGEMPQPWGLLGGRKKDMISRIHSALATIEAAPSVKIPVGLKEAIMAEDFDFGRCMARFGLDWTKESNGMEKSCKARLGSRQW